MDPSSNNGPDSLMTSSSSESRYPDTVDEDFEKSSTLVVYSSPSTSTSSDERHQGTPWHTNRIAKPSKDRSKCRFGVPTCSGCTPEPKTLSQDQIDDHRRMFWAFMFSIGLPGDATISSTSSYRVQLKAAFLDAQFPPAFVDRQQVSEIIDDWLVPRGDAMAAAVDTLLLVQHGLNTKDKRYKIEGKRRHEAALQLLNDGLRKPNAATNDSLLGAIDILGACAMFLDITNGDNRWVVHCRGLCGLLAMRGPHRLDSQFSRNLVCNFRHVALMDALQSRKSFVFGQPEWLKRMQEIEADRPAARMHTLACEVPALLEEADRIVATRGRWVPTITETYAQLVDLEKRLQDWLLQCYKDLPTKSPYRTMDIKHFPMYFEQYGHLNTPFTKCLEFSSNIDTVRHGYYWTVLLALREAIYDLSIARPAALCITTANQTFLKKRVYECTDSLCQTVPFVCSDSLHHIGSSASFPSYVGGALSICCPLQFAMKWYQKQGDHAKVDWCDEIISDVRDHLRAQGLSWLDASLSTDACAAFNGGACAKRRVPAGGFRLYALSPYVSCSIQLGLCMGIVQAYPLSIISAAACIPSSASTQISLEPSFIQAAAKVPPIPLHIYALKAVHKQQQQQQQPEDTRTTGLAG
ncbi:hypothetical protein M409DRAFT_56235 [Zasmidium cellare ATCC 36951]|uniref:Transcription factor domain-containing protein n=1 Tax=Zasmidium cellare ATCC 36951 TaxID=1080233 RepID=A0A6A6CCS7_ZASCE|nr:uncharacterized protein M409DRAFT_56235 [Zasmidium cellare ATCC 36951]KAF2164875.1 hypothetical protein M409DRAFT_56235 [Zasmidium cellare ATCC 36951]